MRIAGYTLRREESMFKLLRFACSACFTVILLGPLVGCRAGRGPNAPSAATQASRAPVSPPDAEGKWIGEWSGGAPGCKLIECVAARQDGETWTAKFRAQCDKEYFYQVEMTGKTVGKVVVFSGSADLGGQYGVYKWTGMVHGDKFLGKYDSVDGKKSGAFWMKRADQ